MTTPLIEIIVSPTGASRVETKGFAGGGCREASRFIEEALGQRAGETLSAEYYLSAEAQQAARQQS